jgi:hypothetical protein
MARSPGGNTRLSLAGEFAVLSQLALRGKDTNLILGQIDILNSDPETDGMLKLEVKTIGKIAVLAAAQGCSEKLSGLRS